MQSTGWMAIGRGKGGRSQDPRRRMDVVSARFPGAERCEMERIARWARVNPQTALGGWPHAALQLLSAAPGHTHPLAGTPLLSCMEDAEAV